VDYEKNSNFNLVGNENKLKNEREISKNLSLKLNLIQSRKIIKYLKECHNNNNDNIVALIRVKKVYHLIIYKSSNIIAKIVKTIFIH
jgi:hypothetical protein